MQKISAIIITKNEQRNIERCLRSLQDVADEVVVVDSGSTDATEQICNNLGAKFTYHPWEGFSGQKNFAISLASHPWLLSIDADEALSDELRDNIIKLKNNALDPNKAYFFNRLNNYCGKWVRHSGWHPDFCTRLWHRGTAVWEGMVHETLAFKNDIKTQHIKGNLLHYTYYTLEQHALKTKCYALLSAEEAFQRGQRGSMVHVVLKPLWSFVRNYLFFGGFLDGRTGFLICRMSAYYSFLKYSRLNELRKEKETIS